MKYPMTRTIMTAGLLLLLLMLTGCGEQDYSGFAKCLTETGMVMYGADWCPHCNAVKKEFGNSFAYINYVECDKNMPDAQPEKCSEAGVEYLPTFVFGDGTKLFGEVSFDILSQKTKCELP